MDTRTARLHSHRLNVESQLIAMANLQTYLHTKHIFNISVISLILTFLSLVELIGEEYSS